MADYLGPVREFLSYHQEPVTAAVLVSTVIGIYVLKKRHKKIPPVQSSPPTPLPPSSANPQPPPVSTQVYREPPKRSPMIYQEGRDRFKPGYVPSHHASDAINQNSRMDEVAFFAEIKESLLSEDGIHEK